MPALAGHQLQILVHGCVAENFALWPEVSALPSPSNRTVCLESRSTLLALPHTANGGMQIMLLEGPCKKWWHSRTTTYGWAWTASTQRTK